MKSDWDKLIKEAEIYNKKGSMKTITIDGVDIQVSDSEIEKLKRELIEKDPKKETLEEILKVTGSVFEISSSGKIRGTGFSVNSTIGIKESTSYDQLESILELNKLANVALKLNDGWVPDWLDGTIKYFLYTSTFIFIGCTSRHHESSVYFKTKELAQKAIDLMGEKSIRKALTLNY
jgi:hypothetical protein